ncbi:MAG: hypothetical protein LBH64_05620 [Coriobacteriales bacterium]|jgi:hypothetical protein|nr:hypothetical protein [Coriobacteriales bacterium]
MNYIERIADRQIARQLGLFGAVLVEGPKWCGKTWAARKASESEFGVAEPEGNFRNREIARLNPWAALEGERPHLIDEWQEVPAFLAVVVGIGGLAKRRRDGVVVIPVDHLG